MAKIEQGCMRKKIFNPNSQESLSDRKIINGDPTGLIELTKVKYSWATKLWKLMLQNTWFPEEVDMTQDNRDYKNLSDPEKRMYDLVLSQLIFMDSVQTNNLADNINPYITAAEVNILLVRQAFEEALHSASYAVMVESISENTEEIYNKWQEDARLLKKNSYIAQVYEDLEVNPSDENKLLAMVANQILEGVYFYAGFACLYTLARSGKMLGTAKMIRFIQRDEVTHLLVFQNMINSIREEMPWLFNKSLEKRVYEMFESAVQLESDWGAYITEGQILGLNNNIINQYIQYIADKRLNATGFERIYNVNHPLLWVESFSKVNDHRSNFFEGTVGNYAKASITFDDL